MGKYSLKMITNTFYSNTDKEELKRILLDMCDEDYNGHNGKDYFVKTKNGNLVSRFEKEWETVKDFSIIKIVNAILDDAYSYDSNYYIQYELKVFEVCDEIVVCLSYMIYE